MKKIALVMESWGRYFTYAWTSGMLSRIKELKADICLYIFNASANWSSDYDAQIDKIAAEYKVSYINFDTCNDAIGLDYSTDTPDGGSHLNTSGAEKFSVYLADFIKDNYKVSDRRGDASYTRNWESIRERYRGD